MNKILAEKYLLYAIWTVATLILLVPLVVTTNTIFPYIVGKAIFARLVIEVIFGLWLILAYLNPFYRPQRSRLLMIFAIYVGVSLLSGVFGVSFQRSLWSTYERMQGIIDLAHWFAFVLVLSSVFRSRANWRFFLNLNLAVSLMVALLGVAQHFDIKTIPLYDFLSSNPRLDITLGNPTFVGAYMMVNILIAIGLLGRSFAASIESNASPSSSRTVRRRRRERQQRRGVNISTLAWRLFWAAAIGLEFWVLSLTGSRGAFLGLVSGLLTFAVFYMSLGRRQRIRLAALGLVLSLVVVGIAFFMLRNSATIERISSKNILVQRLAHISTTDIPVKSRALSIHIGLEGFGERPILGWGPENYLITFGRFFTEDRGTPETFDQAHNKPLEELTTKGILGFVSYAALWIAMFWIVFSSSRSQDSEEQALTLFVGAALAGYFVQNLFLFDTPATVLQLMILMGFVVYLEISSSQITAELSRGPSSSTDGRLALRGWVLFRSDWGLVRFSLPKHFRGLTNYLLIRRRSISLIGIVAFLIFIGMFAYFANYRAYSGASIILQAGRPGNTVEQALGHFDRSIDSFSSLANYPRLILFESLVDNWDNLTYSQTEMAMIAVDREAREALKAEPENWRMYLALAELYMLASSLDPDNLTRAESYLEKGVQLAPEWPEVSQLAAEFTNKQIER